MRAVYVTSGETNLIVKVYASSSRELYDFINSLGPDVSLVSSQVVIKKSCRTEARPLHALLLPPLAV